MEEFPPLSMGGETSGAAMAAGGAGLAHSSSNEGAMGGGKTGVAWSDLFLSRKLSAGGFDLHYSEPAMVDGKKVACCASSMVEEGVQQWKLSLVGHFIGRRPSYHEVQLSLRQQWKLVGNVKICLLDSGFFIFKFSLHEDFLKVIEVGMWTVLGRPLILRPWSPSQNLKRISLSSIPLWVRLPNLPFQYWTAETLSVLGSVLGRPIATDMQTKVQDRLSYAKLCIEMAADSEFPKSIPIHDEYGFVFDQEVQYEWRPPVCDSCKVFGHSPYQCGAAKKSGGCRVWRPKPPSVAVEGVVPLSEEVEEVVPLSEAVEGAAGVGPVEGESDFQISKKLPSKVAAGVAEVAHTMLGNSFGVLREDSMEDYLAEINTTDLGVGVGKDSSGQHGAKRGLVTVEKGKEISCANHDSVDKEGSDLRASFAVRLGRGSDANYGGDSVILRNKEATNVEGDIDLVAGGDKVADCVERDLRGHISYAKYGPLDKEGYIGRTLHDIRLGSKYGEIKSGGDLVIEPIKDAIIEEGGQQLEEDMPPFPTRKEFKEIQTRGPGADLQGRRQFSTRLLKDKGNLSTSRLDALRGESQREEEIFENNKGGPTADVSSELEGRSPCLVTASVIEKPSMERKVVSSLSIGQRTLGLETRGMVADEMDKVIPSSEELATHGGTVVIQSHAQRGNGISSQMDLTKEVLTERELRIKYKNLFPRNQGGQMRVDEGSDIDGGPAPSRSRSVPVQGGSRVPKTGSK